MKSFAVLLLGIFISSCSSQEEKPAESLPKEKPSLFKTLNDLYQVDNRDTIPVYLSFDEEDKSFEGVLIDSVLKKQLDLYLGTEIYGDHYACYRFPIGGSRLGLITRYAGAPESTINLWIYDQQKDSLYDAMVVAESVADAGETMSLQSWLCKGPDGKWNGYTYMHTHSEPMEGDEDTTVIDKETFEHFTFNRNKVIEKEIPRDKFPFPIERPEE